MEIGDRLKILRNEFDYTLEYVSSKLSVARQTLHKYENGIITNIPLDKIEKLAQIYNVTPAYLMGWEDEPKQKEMSLNNDELEEIKNYLPPIKNQYQIPIYGNVAGGLPIDDIETLDYDIIYVDEDTYKRGEIIALRVKGDSMYPLISDGDIVIIRKQNTFDNGDICVVWIEHEGGTIKKVKQDEDGMYLIPYNEDYEIKAYTKKEIEEFNIHVQGKVIEIRRIL